MTNKQTHHQHYTNTELKKIISKLMQYGFNSGKQEWKFTHDKGRVELDISVTDYKGHYNVTATLIHGIEKLFDCSSGKQ